MFNQYENLSQFDEKLIARVSPSLSYNENYQFMITKENESSIKQAKYLIYKTNSIIGYNCNAMEAC
jgi:hypothetical protein